MYIFCSDNIFANNKRPQLHVAFMLYVVLYATKTNLEATQNIRSESSRTGDSGSTTWIEA